MVERGNTMLVETGRRAHSGRVSSALSNRCPLVKSAHGRPGLAGDRVAGRGRGGGMPLSFAVHSPALESVEGLMHSVQRVTMRLEKMVQGVLQGENIKYLIAGALAGIVSRTFVSPLEVVATVNMCSAGACGPPMEELRHLFMREGFRGFFRGNLANCLKVAPTKGIQFLTYEVFKRFLAKLNVQRGSDPSEPLRPWERLAAGGAAGMAAATLCYPLEVAKTLLTTHPETYKGVGGTILKLARQHGFRSLYRGLQPTLFAMFPYVGLEFMIYEQMKMRYEAWSRKEQPTVLVLLLIGALAGSASLTVCHPLDVVRKRMQLQGLGGRPIQYRHFFDAISNIVKTEGPPALYKGLSPTYMSVFPATGMSYVIYEGTKSALGVR